MPFGRKSAACFNQVEKPCVRMSLSVSLLLSQSFHWKSIFGGINNLIGNNRVFHCSFHGGIRGTGQRSTSHLVCNTQLLLGFMLGRELSAPFKGISRRRVSQDVCGCRKKNLVLWCVMVISSLIGQKACKSSRYLTPRCFGAEPHSWKNN